MTSRADYRERQAKRRRQQRVTLAVIIGGVILVIAFLALLPSLAPVGNVTVPDPYDYPSPKDHAIGDPNAPVVIEEFSDFQCPFCRRFHDDTLPKIIDNYVREGKVYFVYRHFPVVDRNDPAQESHAAATAAVCAGRQNRFWDYHDILFANQTGENIGNYTEKRLQAMAEAIGLDMTSFDECYASADAAAAVAADALLALESSLNSTPSFLINGNPLIGAQPWEVFEAAIEAELPEG
ncbi:MAG TPA: thioredoxin domain-containing protein [Anaerolineales bacterium]|nr:thioredoxin domain-containing protein [Anaerolineales bacterium]